MALTRARASGDLIGYVEEQLPLKHLANDGAYSLFIVLDESPN
jgi:hypothetical protein